MCFCQHIIIPGLCPCDVVLSLHFLFIFPLESGHRIYCIYGERETPVYRQLMEMLVSQGRILSLAPFCKSFVPVANNCREGLRAVRSLRVRACSDNICLRSGKSCRGGVVQSFSTSLNAA